MYGEPRVVLAAYDAFDPHEVCRQLGELIFELLDVDGAVDTHPGSVDTVCMTVGMPTVLVVNMLFHRHVLDVGIREHPLEPRRMRGRRTQQDLRPGREQRGL